MSEIKMQCTTRMLRTLRRHANVTSARERNVYALVVRVTRDWTVAKTIECDSFADAERKYASMRKSANASDSVAVLMRFADGYGLIRSDASDDARMTSASADADDASADNARPRSTRASERTLRASTDASATRKSATRKSASASKNASKRDSLEKLFADNNAALANASKRTNANASKRTNANASKSASANAKQRTSAENERTLRSIANYAQRLGLSNAALRREFGTFDATTRVHDLRAIARALRERVNASK